MSQRTKTVQSGEVEGLGVGLAIGAGIGSGLAAGTRLTISGRKNQQPIKLIFGGLLILILLALAGTLGWFISEELDD